MVAKDEEELTDRAAGQGVVLDGPSGTRCEGTKIVSMIISTNRWPFHVRKGVSQKLALTTGRLASG